MLRCRRKRRGGRQPCLHQVKRIKKVICIGFSVHYELVEWQFAIYSPFHSASAMTLADLLLVHHQRIMSDILNGTMHCRLYDQHHQVQQYCH